MLSAYVLLLALPTAAGTPKPLKLASAGFSCANLSQELATFYADHLAQQMSMEGKSTVRGGLNVLTPKHLASVIGFEKQKQLLGCSDNTSCLTEIGNALGVDGIVTGSIAKLGKAYQANVSVLSSKDAALLAGVSLRADGEEQLLDALSKAARTLCIELAIKLKRSHDGAQQALASAEAAGKPISTRTWALLPTVGGVAAAGAGTYFFIQAHEVSNQLAGRGDFKARTFSLEEGAALVAKGKRLQMIALPALGVGLAGLLLGGAMFTFGGSSDVAVEPRVAAGEGMFAIAMGGTLP